MSPEKLTSFVGGLAYFMTHSTNDSVCTYPQFGVPQADDLAEVNGCTPRDTPTPSGQQPSTWVPEETWDFISQF